MYRKEINIQTGEEIIIELTPEEIEELESRAAEQSQSQSQSQPTPLTPAEKLERAGLTVEELKELLGL
jgi:hypothetical protein